MTQSFRFIPVAATLTMASALIACTTSPAMTMGSSPAGGMAMSDHSAKMDAQMKTMRDMHEKMMNAKSPEDRGKLMAEHMKTMQDGMATMGDMKGMQGMQAMPGEMGARHQMMEKRMEMMQTMMTMMMDRMPAAPAR